LVTLAGMTTEISTPAYEAALRHVAARAAGGPLAAGVRVTAHFHPDRFLPDGRPVLAAMAQDGVYLSQFVTGTGNGGLTAHPGGDRWRWESRIFGGVYDTARADHRPVYGGLNRRHDPLGAAPRFGSSYFRFGAATLRRATFCYPDSAAEPADFGVADRCSALVDLADADVGADALDDYVEAHVHGPVRFDRDVEALVLDPCYRSTPVEDAARALPCPVEWHPGFVLGVDELRRHPDYRGAEFVELGVRIAVDGRIDPAVIGAAARTGEHDPQALKKVWHLLARFGRRPV
jgi:hypothetical protein